MTFWMDIAATAGIIAGCFAVLCGISTLWMRRVLRCHACGGRVVVGTNAMCRMGPPPHRWDHARCAECEAAFWLVDGRRLEPLTDPEPWM